MPSLPVTGGRKPYECTIEGKREVEHQSEREIMKGKLYETLIGTDARLAITISGEELKEFIEGVMADARLRAESEIKAKQSEECIDKEEVKTLLRVCDTTLWKWAKRGKLVPQKVGSRNIYRKSDVLAVLRGEK